MFKDFTIALWLLKLGALLNLYFLANTCALPSGTTDAHIVIPAQILFAVSAYRCLFPVWYKDNVVFHDSPFSSIFVTRLLATFVEVAYIYQFSHVIRLLNVDHVGWVNGLSWLMVLQVVISQGCVWGAILSQRLVLYYYEELGWGIIFAANTLASAYLYATVDTLAGREILLQLNLLFGVVYLPWQLVHLRALHSDAKASREAAEPGTVVTWERLAKGLADSIHVRNRKIDAAAWGGLVVETATFGSEFVTARTTIDQIVDLRMTLRYLGVPVREKSYVFGDNKTVIDSSSTPHAKLHKRHNALSFHRVREAVASKYVTIFHLSGEHNPADILSKHWAYASAWRTMNALLFARGDTWNLLDDDDEEEQLPHGYMLYVWTMLRSQGE